MSSSRPPQTTAVVTEAGDGFGSAIAAALVDHGHQIARLCRDTDNQDEHRVHELTGHKLHAMA
ncbi:MAG TPA: hypothetical protein VGE11_01055 [Pseudonocardia sp.]